MTDLDIARLREDTPACQRVVHFNNAGAALMPRPVADAVIDHLRNEERFGGYEAEKRAAETLTAFYGEFAGLLNAGPDEIAYVENATRAWDMAFYGLRLGRGDRLITHAPAEYVSNYLGLRQQAARRGFEVDLAPSDSDGLVDVSALDAMVTPQTRAILLTHATTAGGMVNPAAQVGEIARRHGLIYMLDACQSVGQIQIDVQAIGCDVLSGTGRKYLRGPRGTGFLYVRRGRMNEIEPAFVDLKSAVLDGTSGIRLAPDAKRYETWESNVAGRIGLVTAVRYARAIGLDRIEARVRALAETLRAALARLPGVTVHDRGRVKSGLVTFRIEGETPAETMARMAGQGINIWISSMLTAPMDFGPRGIDSLSRASVHYYNTEDEIGRLIEALPRR
ncbi:MAG TPA: aminotransferase class V-fold PLP-dependent enzyme [Burkholderiales bacterium]